MCRFRTGEASLGPVYRQLLQHYRPKIHHARRGQNGEDEGDESVTADDSRDSHDRAVPYTAECNRSSSKEQQRAPGQSSVAASTVSPGSSSDDAVYPGRTKVDPIVKGAVSGDDDTDKTNALAGAAGAAGAATQALLPARAAGATSEFTTTITTDDDHNSGGAQDWCRGRQQRQEKEEDSPPRPVLAGPAATEVSAVLGGEHGLGSCAVAPTGRKTTSAGGKARVATRDGGGRGSGSHGGSRLGGGGGGGTGRRYDGAEAPRSPPVRASSPRSQVPSTKSRTTSVSPTATKIISPLPSSPSFRRKAAAARGAAVQPARRETPELATTETVFPRELLRSLVGVDKAGGAGCGQGVNGELYGGSAVAGGVVFCDLDGTLGSPRFPEGLQNHGAGTAGTRRQCRVRAMEDAKRLVMDVDKEMVWSDTPHLEHLLAVALRLANDPDFKIVRTTRSVYVRAYSFFYSVWAVHEIFIR